MSNPVQEAIQLRRHGNVAAAEQMLRSHLRGNASDAAAHRLLALCLCDLARPDQAVFHAKRAVDLSPGNADALVTHANTLALTRALAPAIENFRAALAIKPDNDNAALGLGGSLTQLGHFDEAGEVLTALLARTPGHAPGRRALARALDGAGRVDDAIREYRAALVASAGDARTLAALCLALQGSDTAKPEEIAAVHRRFGDVVAARAADIGPSLRLSPAVADNPDRPLRIGYVSPDFRDHSVASFIEPLLRAHDRSAFTPVCFFTGSVSDHVTKRLESTCEFYRVPITSAAPQTPSQSDADLARRITSAMIDVVVDLAGHTGGSVLGALALRPAPLQITYLGYPDTTGLSAVEARLVDATTDPERPEFDARCVEQLVRLPRCFLAYQPREEAPPVAPAPVLADPQGTITFGSFNNLKKLSPSCLSLFAHVLANTPGSRLLIKGKVASSGARDRLLSALKAGGISADRVELVPYTDSVSDHLAQYARVDIALDTFPYNGTTTTCEALWQGVPVITRRGDRHAARVGASILEAVGLGELVAADDDSFVRLAAKLASDTAGLASMRAGMRDRLSRSPLLDAAGHARAVESAIRTLWRARCAKQG